MSDQSSTMPGVRDVVAQDAARLATEGEPGAWGERQPSECIRDYGHHDMASGAEGRPDSMLTAIAAEAIEAGLTASYAFCRRCGSGWVTVGERAGIHGGVPVEGE